jgi:hypothetical protein
VSVNEHRVDSWAELQALLFDDMWNERLGLFRSSFAYRGNADASVALASGLIRLGGDVELERQLMRAFRKYARQDAVPHDTGRTRRTSRSTSRRRISSGTTGTASCG